MSAATPGQAAREQLASAVHDLFGADCPNEPCPQCARREAGLMDLADDYAGAGLPDSPLAADNTRLRKERDGLRGQLQAVRRLMADAAANGIIDSGAIVALLDAAPQPAPELAAAMVEARGYRDALQLIRGRENDPIAQVRHVARIAKRALGGKP